MLSHRQLSAWYLQLAQQLEAGLRLAEALRSSQGAGLPATGTETMAALIENGGSVEGAFALTELWLPLGDRLVLSAAAEAGRMPQVLRSLAARHAELGAAKRRVILASVYPLAVLLVGLVLLPLTRMIDWEKGFTWDAAVYGRMLAFMIVPLWGIGIAIAVAIRRQSRVLAAIALRLPYMGSYLRAQGLADFAFALGNFLDAGMRIDRAWSTAGTVTNLARVKTAATAMAPVIARGEKPSGALSAWSCFPPDFVALYKSGELTGQLDQNLLRLAATYQEQANAALKLLTFFYPTLLFLTVAGGVVYSVVTFYAGYLRMIEQLAK